MASGIILNSIWNLSCSPKLCWFIYPMLHCVHDWLWCISSLICWASGTAAENITPLDMDIRKSLTSMSYQYFFKIVIWVLKREAYLRSIEAFIMKHFLHAKRYIKGCLSESKYGAGQTSCHLIVSKLVLNHSAVENLWIIFSTESLVSLV